MIQRRTALALLAASAATPLWAQTGTGWPAIEAKARGQTVYFNAWAGSERINAYLQWAGVQVLQRYGVKVEHVKVTDTADVVKRVRGEKAAGKLADGSVDLVWINGENFLTMKRDGMLFGPFAENLPSFQYVDVQGKPTTRLDFSEPVEGLEVPWGMAQLTFYADSKKVPNPPKSMAALLEFAKAHPGRVTYPRPPNFHGTTFVKQALVEFNADRSALYKPATPEALAKAAVPLWAYLDALHPHLWRNGKQFVQKAAVADLAAGQRELLHHAVAVKPVVVALTAALIQRRAVAVEAAGQRSRPAAPGEQLLGKAITGGVIHPFERGEQRLRGDTAGKVSRLGRAGMHRQCRAGTETGAEGGQGLQQMAAVHGDAPITATAARRWFCRRVPLCRCPSSGPSCRGRRTSPRAR